MYICTVYKVYSPVNIYYFANFFKMETYLHKEWINRLFEGDNNNAQFIYPFYHHGHWLKKCSSVQIQQSRSPRTLPPEQISQLCGIRFHFLNVYISALSFFFSDTLTFSLSQLRCGDPHKSFTCLLEIWSLPTNNDYYILHICNRLFVAGRSFPRSGTGFSRNKNQNSQLLQVGTEVRKRQRGTTDNWLYLFHLCTSN